MSSNKVQIAQHHYMCHCASCESNRSVGFLVSSLTPTDRGVLRCITHSHTQCHTLPEFVRTNQSAAVM